MKININKSAPGLAKKAAAAGLAVALMAPAARSSDFGGEDFGTLIEQLLHSKSQQLFGIGQPVGASAPATVGNYRTATQSASAQVLVADGLKVEYLTRNAGNSTDMMTFYPAENPTHLITCVEGSRSNLGAGKYNPSVQRINLATGVVETVLRGMDACDGIRTTPWGTVLATEERKDGSAYEILNPLSTNTLDYEINITDRGACGNAATFDKSTSNVAKRTALPCMAWEGLIILPSGVVIAGDELRPGTSVADGSGGVDSDGGAIFKFIPAGAAPVNPITNLTASPFVAGTTHALQVSCNGDGQQYGQGCEVGNAAWVSVNAATARADARTNGATGYYRPEDLEQDPTFADGDAIRFCWTNTQEEDALSFGEVMCAIDEEPLTASATARTVVVYRFVEGDQDFNSFDNLAFQPKTGILYVIEDHPNGDIFACLPDGADRDIKSDGCMKILSVKDSSAEPTGFIFDSTGTTAYLSVQHSNDGNMPLFDGYRTDDVLKITGFQLKK